jgi:hypothetical protein
MFCSWWGEAGGVGLDWAEGVRGLSDHGSAGRVLGRHVGDWRGHDHQPPPHRNRHASSGTMLLATFSSSSKLCLANLICTCSLCYMFVHNRVNLLWCSSRRLRRPSWCSFRRPCQWCSFGCWDDCRWTSLCCLRAFVSSSPTCNLKIRATFDHCIFC